MNKSDAPQAPSVDRRAHLSKTESVRRADGTLGEKQPPFDSIKELEDKRRRILRRVSD